jgi:hypothetical protein
MLISLVVTLRWSSVKCSAWLDSTGWSCPGPWWLVTCYSLLVTRYSLLVTRPVSCPEKSVTTLREGKNCSQTGWLEPWPAWERWGEVRWCTGARPCTPTWSGSTWIRMRTK